MKETLSNYIMQLKQIDKKYRLSQCICYIIAVASPFIIAVVATRADGHGLSQMIPFWNDEANYFLQLRGMFEFGAPLGFNGYNGSHAQVLTFGTHGLGVFIPYYLFASIFGLHFYTIALCGLFMMSGAILFYVLALKPDKRQVAFLILCTSAGAILMHTAMMATGFISYMIAMAVFFIRIYRKNELSYKITAFFFLVFISFAAPSFAPFMFMYLMLVVKYKRWYVNMLISLIGMAVFTVAAYGVFTLFSAPYWYSRLSFDPSALLTDFFGTVIAILRSIFSNFFVLLPQVVQENSIWGVYIAMLVYFTVIFFVYFCATELMAYAKTREFKDNRDAKIIMLSGLTMIGFITLWSGVMNPLGATTLRSILPIFMFMAAIISVLEIRKKASFISLLSIIGAMIIVFSGWGGHITGREYATQDFISRVEAAELFFEESVVISPEKSRWENTIASYFRVPDIYWLNAPAGAGWNLYWRDSFSENEKYVLIPHSFYDIIAHYLSAGYVEINSTESVVLLLNPRYLP